MPMSLPARSFYSKRVPTTNASRLPTPRVVKTLVAQPINLRPMGNTISMSVPAEMPFLNNTMTVVTQASGGMAKPDPAMQSQRLRSRFLPISGLGSLGDTAADTAYSWFNQYDADARNMNRAQYDASPKKAYWEGQVAASQPAQPSIWNTITSALSPLASSAADIAKSKIAAGATKAGTTIVNQYGTPVAPAKKSMTIPLVIGGVVVAGVLLFLFMKKKSA